MGNYSVPLNVQCYSRGVAQTEVVITELNCVFFQSLWLKNTENLNPQ